MSAAEPRPGLRKIAPYSSPQLDLAVRLNTNECPYPLPEGYQNDLGEAVRSIPLNRYPDREALRLREALGEQLGRAPEGIWAANGSNEAIEQLLLAYGGPGRRAALFPPTYELHERLAWGAHTDVVRVPLEPPFVLASEHVRRAAQARPSLAFVCSPNNPTGNAQPLEAIEELAAAAGTTLVIVDEAYVEFGGKPATGMLDAHENLVVTRTFSKAFALAGARLGYLLAAPSVIDDLRRITRPYHVSALTQAAGLVAIRYHADAVAILDGIRRERDRLIEGLSAIPGVEAYPSDANFVLFRPPAPATGVWRALLDRGVLVRDVSAAVTGCLRVTAGTQHEVDAFLSALREILS